MKPDAEERRKAIMYDLDSYHDTYGRNPDNPTFLPAAVLAAVGWIIAVAGITWVAG